MSSPNENVRSIAGEKASIPDSDSTPPALLTLSMLRRHYLPLAQRTLFRMISAGAFPAADIKIGSKIRLWRRQTIEGWIDATASQK